MAAAGDKLVAVATAFNRVDASSTTTNTSYTGTLTGGGAAGVAFIAPPTGKVTILFGTAGFNDGNGRENKTAVRVGTGSTVGAGTQVYAPNDNDMILVLTTADTNTYGLSSFAEVSGLTAGGTYNVQVQHKVNAGTGTWLYKRVKVIPDL
jgi:hypothetical protein